MPDGLGYAKFDDFPIHGAVTIDGYTMTMKMQQSAGFSDSVFPRGSSIEMGDGTHVYQCTLPKPKQPLTMGPVSQSFGFRVTHREDMVRIRRAGRSGWPVLVWLGMPHEDEWFIPGGDAGQTEWRTSRRLGWNGTTRTHATHPPYAAIVTGQTVTEQTIVTAGTPVAGEVKIPTSQAANQYYDSITTPVLTSGDRLIVRYWPEMLCRLTVTDSFQVYNQWDLGVDLVEFLAGDYS